MAKTRSRNEDDWKEEEEQRRRTMITQLFGGPWNMLNFSSPLQLYADVRANCEKYCDLQNEAYYDVLSSVVFLSHRINEFDFTPYIHLLGPPESGKTKVEEWLEKLCNRPLHSSSMSPASLYQLINEFSPCLLIDEIDRLGREQSEYREAMLCILNAGQRRGVPAVRASKDGGTPYIYYTFGLKVLAGTEPLPDTLESRCVILYMEQSVRRVPVEIDKTETDVLRSQLERYQTFHDTTPLVDLEELSQRIGNNRLAELFYPLIAVNPDPQARARLEETAKEIMVNRREEEGTGQYAEVLETVVVMKTELDKMAEAQKGLDDKNSLVTDRIVVGEVTKRYNATHEYGAISSETMGKMLRRLGFKPAKIGKESRRAIWVRNRKHLYRQARRFLPELASEMLAKFPEELGVPVGPSVLSVPSANSENPSQAVSTVGTDGSTDMPSMDLADNRNTPPDDIDDPTSIADGDVAPWEEPTETENKDEPSNNGGIGRVSHPANRIDWALVADYIIRTIMPKETLRISYAVTEKIVYGCVYRYGESVRALVPQILEKLAEDKRVVPGPFRETWKLAK